MTTVSRRHDPMNPRDSDNNQANDARNWPLPLMDGIGATDTVLTGQGKWIQPG